MQRHDTNCRKITPTETEKKEKLHLSSWRTPCFLIANNHNFIRIMRWILNINYSEKSLQLKPKHSPQIIFVPSIRVPLILVQNLKSEANTRGVQCMNFREIHSNGRRDKIAKLYCSSSKVPLIIYLSKAPFRHLWRMSVYYENEFLQRSRGAA